MNMNKALQHLYKAVSGNDTSKVNISKLLVDIHYALTGVQSPVKNNWSKIIDSIATNWTGGGGSSDLAIATVNLVDNDGVGAMLTGAFCIDQTPVGSVSTVTWYTDSGAVKIALYKGNAIIDAGGIVQEGATFSLSGDAVADTSFIPYGILVTGDCTITVA